MKQHKKSSSAPFTIMVDKELETHIEKTDRELVHKHKTKTSQKLSVLEFDKLPASARISDFIGELVMDYQKLIDHTNGKIAGEVQRLKSQSHIAENKDSDKQLSRKRKKLLSVLNPLIGSYDDSAKKYRPAIIKWQWMIVLLVGISFAELLTNIEIIATLGGGFATNLGIGLLTSICVYWWAHISPTKVRQWGGDNTKRQVLVFLLLLLPVVAVFTVLALLRIQYLQILDPNGTSFNTSPLPFIFINTFAYLISFWIVWMYRPAKQILESYRKYRRDTKRINTLNNALESLQQKQDALPGALREQLTDRYAILLLGKNTEDEIESRMKSCYEQFKAELYLKTNGRCAPLFTGKLPKDLPQLHRNYKDISAEFENAQSTL